ncbi:MAG TPA: hypothetical protein VMW65_18280 [Chloroflexota bacterium]|nr:hypothetical protein [Chloroflexota bacterium]
MISALYSVPVSLGVNRVIRGARIEHVCGNPGLGPERDYAYRRQIVWTALQSLTQAVSTPVLLDPTEEAA